MSQDQKPRPPSRPRSPGRYQVVKKLGAGAFGTVYQGQGQDPRPHGRHQDHPPRGPGRRRAPTSTRCSTASSARPQVSAQLKHPNIVTIYDIGDADGMSYLAMEFIDGVGLEKVIAQGQLPLERAAAIGAQVADALDFAHQHSVVHRDIKPANIMIEAGRPGEGHRLRHRQGHGLRPITSP